MSERIDAAHEQTVKILKKVLATRGRLGANFYFAFKGDEVALVTTLSKRDPEGRKVLTKGKAIRRELRGAKFCRGTVGYADGKKPVFDVSGGTATPIHLRNALRKQLAKRVEGLQFLRKALVAQDDSDEPEEVLSAEEETAIERSLTLTESERAELLRDEQELARVQLHLDTFLSQASIEAEKKEALEDLEVGQAVDEEMLAALHTSAAGQRSEIEAKLSEAIARIHAIADEVDSADETWRAEHAPRKIRTLERLKDSVSGYLTQLKAS